MSNAKQETIADIVAEMRTLGRLDEKSTDKIPRTLQALGLRTYADRIEAAAKQAVTDCNHLGNAAKMREALERIRRELILDSCRRTITKFHDIVCEVSYSALVAPPRNCDVLSKDEVLKVLDDRSFSKEDTIEWLYAEAKGETK